MDSGFEVYTLAPDERRMLLEMLASERAGESSLHVGERFGRNLTARRLVDLQMTQWVARDGVAFTEYGRHLAESLACRLTRAPDPHAC